MTFIQDNPIKYIIKNLNEPIFVLTCDNVIEIDFDKYFQEYIKLQSPACMIIPTQYSKEFEGDSIYFDFHMFRPESEFSGMRRSRDIARQIVSHIADMESEYFANRK